ncbi:MAG: hypothetical protein HY905_27120 [Deltaproteobacteria bacterium]|nr:hypothetical protein [Deltaproteobacteria bacterium]
MLRWGGVGWRFEVVADAFEFRALWGSGPDDVWGAGSGDVWDSAGSWGDGTPIGARHWDGREWNAPDCLPAEVMEKIWGASFGEVWGATDGTMLRMRR